MSYSANPLTIFQLSDKEIGHLLADNFFKLGIRIMLTPDELSKLVLEIHRYQGRVKIDDFNEAFSKLAAGAIEVKERMGVNSWFIGRVIKSFRGPDKVNHQSKIKDVENTHGLPPPTDADYYVSLVCLMNGKKSDRFSMAFPDTLPGPGNIVPMAWAWSSVYRHLKTLKEVDDVSGTDEEKTQVMRWLFIKWPNASLQKDMFPASQSLMRIANL